MCHGLSVSFNSLQTGKPFRTALIDANADTNARNVSIPFKRESPFGQGRRKKSASPPKICFNSLQTGKPFRTVCLVCNLPLSVPGVSIPFKRESPFGHSLLSNERNSTLLWFQFPSNGKALSDTFMAKTSCDRIYDPFQFPSNGKALSDGITTALSSSEPGIRFNSLQTGKPFRTFLLTLS